MEIEAERKLVEMYGKNRLLWDTNYPGCYCFDKRRKAWREIAQEVGHPEKELKKKIQTLLSSYRRERMRATQCKDYKSNWYGMPWFAFYNEFYDEKQKKKESTSPQLPNNAEYSALNSISSGHSYASPPSKKMSLDNPESSGIKTETLFETLVKRNSPDQYDAFGNYLSSELRKYESRVLPHVKRAILDVLFKADTGGFDEEVKESSDDQTLPNEAPSSSSALNIADVDSESKVKIEVFKEELV